jgi:hypothetical protein
MPNDAVNYAYTKETAGGKTLAEARRDRSKEGEASQSTMKQGYDRWVKGTSKDIADTMAAKANEDVKHPSYKKGGMVRKTGLAKLHKGEKVLTRKQAGKHRGGKRG